VVKLFIMNLRIIKIIALLLVTTSSKSYSQRFGFVEIDGGGYVTSVIACPAEKNLFYAKTDVGGISRWQESTASWKPLFGWVANNQTSYLGAEALAIDPQSPNKLYVLAGTSYWDGGKSAILRSEDYGETWKITDVTNQFKANGNGSDRQKGETLAIDPNKGNILFCGTRYNNGLFKSTDSGVSWQKVSSFSATDASISFVVFDAASGTKGNSTPNLFAGVFREGADNLFVSKDGGSTWTSIGGHSAGKPQRCAISTDRNLYVTYAGTAGAVKKFSIEKDTWSDCTPPISWSANRGFCGIDVDVNDPKKVVASTYNWWQNEQQWGWADAIYYSSDSGATWREKAGKSVATMDNNGIPWIHAAMHWVGCVKFNPAKPGWVFVVSGNGIFASENIAAANPVWKFMAKGLEETVMLDLISIPGGPLISSVGDQGGFVHTDITKAPLAQISQSSGFAFAGLKPNVIARVATDLYLSEDGGATWNKLPATPDGTTNGKVAISADGKIIIWKSVKDGIEKCYCTNGKGLSWIACNGVNFSFYPMADPVNALKFYAYNSSTGYLYISSDGGKNFLPGSFAATGGTARIAVSNGKAGNIWIAMKSKGLTYSVDGGASFQTLPVFSCDAVASGKEPPGSDIPTIFIYGRPTSSDIPGIYYSTDRGKTWIRADDDQHQFGNLANGGLIEADRNVYGRVYRSTAGMGIPYIQLESIPTSIETIVYQPQISFFPNPFTSTILMNTGTAYLKQVQIYNIAGSILQTLIPAHYNNQLIEMGSDLKPGMYLIKVSGNQINEVHKIIKL